MSAQLKQTLLALGAGFALLLAIGAVMVGAGAQAPNPYAQASARAHFPHGKCFPAAAWANRAPRRHHRPCARILAVQEDGSVSVGVYSAETHVQRYQFDVGAQDR